MMKTTTSGTAAGCRRAIPGLIRRRSLVVCVVWMVACCGGFQSASAQSWQTLLKDVLQSLGGSSTANSSQEQAAVPVPPSDKALRGTWIYQAPAISYTGADMLATLAVTTLEGQLPAYYQQAGLQPGVGTFTFERNGVFTAVLGTKRLAGTYAYHADTGDLTISFPLEGKPTSFSGKVTCLDEQLTLLFEASETLRTLRGASTKFAQNQRAQQISTILDAYPGIMLGAKFKQ